MLNPKGPSGRRSWSIGSARFMRDVCASVLATALATIAFSHLSHEPAPRVEKAGAKDTDRLAWQEEDVPTRLTRSYDTHAMWALPRTEPSAWTEVAARGVEQHAEAAPKAAPIERRRSAALPPIRPAFVTASATAASQATPSGLGPVAVVPRQSGLNVLGWHVPGSDLLPAELPGGRAALKTLASVGDGIAGVGSILAETVGLK